MKKIDRNYVSETDEFISKLHKTDPNLKQKQKNLRNTWWDRGFINDNEQKSYVDASVPAHGYAYYDYSTDEKK